MSWRSSVASQQHQVNRTKGAGKRQYQKHADQKPASRKKQVQNLGSQAWEGQMDNLTGDRLKWVSIYSIELVRKGEHAQVGMGNELTWKSRKG